MRELRGHRLDARIEAGEQLGAAGVGIGVKLVGGLVECRQPLADAAVRIARGAQDLVELAADLGNLLKADLVDLVRRIVGGRRLGERGGIDLVPARDAPDAVAGGGGGTQGTYRRDLAVERGIDLLGDDLAGPRSPVAGNILRGRAGRDRVRHRASVGRRAAQFAHLLQGQVERPAGSEEAARRLAPLFGGLVVEDGGELLEARQIGVGVGLVLDRVGRIEDVGDEEISAVLLRDDIGTLRVGDVEPLGADVARPQVP